MENKVWVFNGVKSKFPSAVFTNFEEAENWIAKHDLTGVLTLYPINTGVYDWAIENGYFKPGSEKDKSPTFIENFTTASQDHYHYENGTRD